MIDILTLAYFSMGTGGFFGNLMFFLDQNGFFSYGLPFLMIFMISFGILSKVKILGDNKALNVVISLVVGLMAVQLNFVSYFFSEIFPRMGVLLSIILVSVIVLSPFVKFKKKSVASITLSIVGAIGVIVIVIQSLGNIAWFNSFGSTWGITYFFQQWGSAVFTAIFFFALIVVPIVLQKKKEEKKKRKKVIIS